MKETMKRQQDLFFQNNILVTPSSVAVASSPNPFFQVPKHSRPISRTRPHVNPFKVVRDLSLESSVEDDDDFDDFISRGHRFGNGRRSRNKVKISTGGTGPFRIIRKTSSKLDSRKRADFKVKKHSSRNSFVPTRDFADFDLDLQFFDFGKRIL